MLSKSQNKYIRSLTQQKIREENNAFIAEGEKIASEWLQTDSAIKMIIATASWVETHKTDIKKHAEAGLHIVTESELQSVSGLQTANQVLLVIDIPTSQQKLPADEWCIALDTIQDPGNMGTIIRIADWFGIRHIVASPGCVDFYNPKVVQSAMGGHLRVNLHKSELLPFISSVSIPVLAAALGGEPITSIKKPQAAVLLIGNESKGLSPELLKKANQKITIPGKGGAESLNAAVSTGIICAMLMS